MGEMYPPDAAAYADAKAGRARDAVQQLAECVEALADLVMRGDAPSSIGAQMVAETVRDKARAIKEGRRL